MCRNHRGFIEATIACAKLGASALYLNTMFAGPAAHRRDASARSPTALDLRRGVRRAARRRRRRGRARFVAWERRGDGPTRPTLEELIAGRTATDLEPPDEHGRFVILTSGTTGTPKGAQRSQPEGLGAARGAVLARSRCAPRETMMIAAPLFHSWGFVHFVLSLPTGSTIVLRPPLRPGGDAAGDRRAPRARCSPSSR